MKSRNNHPKRNINSKKQELQKQLFADLYQNSVLKNFATSFNRFTGFKACNFLKKILQHRCLPVLESLSKKVAGLEARKSIKKETPSQVFSCEYCEIFKNSFFYRTSLVAASGIATFFSL